MGGRPLTAMAVMGVPIDLVPLKIVNQILRGGAEKVLEAKCSLVGGHTIRNPEPFYGLSVTGLVNPSRMITNADGRPGDLLVLTKPLGTGIVTTALKRKIGKPSLIKKAVDIMKQLNLAGATLAEAGLVRAGTDVTGFGLLGHLGSLCRASNVAAELTASALPAIDPQIAQLIADDCIPGGTRDNLKSAEQFTDFTGVSDFARYLLVDAQTSGGLLLCLPPRKLPKVLRILKHLRTPSAAVVGKLMRSSEPKIWFKN